MLREIFFFFEKRISSILLRYYAYTAEANSVTFVFTLYIYFCAL